MKNKVVISFFYFFVFLLLFSCHKKANEKIIPKDKFANILVQIHKADALFKTYSLFDAKLGNPANLSYYNQIFVKNKITRNQFYSSLRYYIKHFDMFVNIEKIVLDSLNKRYNYLDSLDNIVLKKNDIWNLKKSWNLPKDGVTNSIPFNFYTNKNGTYTISAKIRVYDDDMSKDLKIELFAYYANGTHDSRFLRIRKDSEQWEDYSLAIHTNGRKKLDHIGGHILGHTISTNYMHIAVKDICLIFKPDSNDKIKSVQK